MDSGHNGLNDGTKGGRICWAVAGTFCGGEVQGEYAQKIDSCMDCDFFKLVKREEHPNFKLLQPGMIYVMGPHGEHNESDRQG